jgi:hypothetical protein
MRLPDIVVGGELYSDVMPCWCCLIAALFQMLISSRISVKRMCCVVLHVMFEMGKSNAGAKVQHDLMKGCTRAETRLPTLEPLYNIPTRQHTDTIAKSARRSMASFNIQPLARFAGASTSIRRPRELTYFSYDDNRTLHPQSESSLQYYYPPFIDTPSESGQAKPTIDLSRGFNTFKKHDDQIDEHLDSLLETLMSHEQKEGQRTKSDIITWRGIMTKVDI